MLRTRTSFRQSGASDYPPKQLASTAWRTTGVLAGGFLLPFGDAIAAEAFQRVVNRYEDSSDTVVCLQKKWDRSRSRIRESLADCIPYVNCNCQILFFPSKSRLNAVEIEEWAGECGACGVLVVLHHAHGTDALVALIAVVATGTGVHGCDQHEVFTNGPCLCWW